MLQITELKAQIAAQDAKMRKKVDEVQGRSTETISNLQVCRHCWSHSHNSHDVYTEFLF